MTEATKKNQNDPKILADLIAGKSTTSAKIRSLVSHFRANTPGTGYGPTVRALKSLGVQTKNGGDIRFQHVRNVMTQQLKKN